MNKRYLIAVAAAGLLAFAPAAAFAEESPAPVYGDALVKTQSAPDFNTEHDAVVEVKAGEELTLRCDLDGSVVLKQIEETKEKYRKDFAAFNIDALVTNQKWGDKIKLSNTSMTFTTKIVMPEGMAATAATEATLNNADRFTVTSAGYNETEKTYTVVMTLKTEDIPTFADLYDIIINQKKTVDLQLSLSHIKIADTVAPETTLTAAGTIEGKFSSDASVGFISMPFKFAWKAVQDKNIGAPNVAVDGTETLEGADGTDALFPGSDEIKLSVRTAKAETPDSKPDPKPEPKPDPTSEAKPEPKPESKSEGVQQLPKTGEVASMAAPLALMGASLLAFARRRK